VGIQGRNLTFRLDDAEKSKISTNSHETSAKKNFNLPRFREISWIVPPQPKRFSAALPGAENWLAD
jgi:hypothetical protein